MLTPTSCLLLAMVALYLLVQAVVNYKTLSNACDRSSVAGALNAVNMAVAVLAVVYFGYRSTRGA